MYGKSGSLTNAYATPHRQILRKEDTAPRVIAPAGRSNQEIAALGRHAAILECADKRMTKNDRNLGIEIKRFQNLVGLLLAPSQKVGEASGLAALAFAYRDLPGHRVRRRTCAGTPTP
jgi:hypothetical protein